MAREFVIKGILVPMIAPFIPITFIYNPTEIGDEKGSNYAQLNPIGRSHPVYHFMNGEAREITFTIELNDRYLKYGSLELYIDRIRKFQYPTVIGGNVKKGPPVVKFVLGQLFFDAIIINTGVIRKQWTRFGFLQRAEIDLTLNQITNRNVNATDVLI